MAESALRVGVVGAGWFASRRHLPDLKAQQGVEVVALCRRDAEKLRAVADRFDVPGRYRDYGEMLAREEMDAVLVATPHALHYAHARAGRQFRGRDTGAGRTAVPRVARRSRGPRDGGGLPIGKGGAARGHLRG